MSIFSKARIKSLIKFSVAALFVVMTSGAQGQQFASATSSDGDVEVLYKGVEAGRMHLLVRFTNTGADKYAVRISEHSVNIYNEVYDGNTYTKLFKVPVNSSEVVFTVQNLRTKAKSTFAANSILRSYTDVDVKRID